MVLDTSVVLAVFFKENYYDWAIDQMNLYANELRMSTVNLTETLIRLQDKQPHLFQIVEEKLLYSGIRFVAPDISQSKLAAKARMTYPLNLGDCFAYALAVEENCPILTLDKDFRLLNVNVIHPFKKN